MTFKLKAVCTDKAECEVSTKSIEPTNRDDAMGIDNKAVAPAALFSKDDKQEDPILVVKLSRNQQVDFNLIAKKGMGKMHSKWSPVATCIMRKIPSIKLDHDKIQQTFSQD